MITSNYCVILGSSSYRAYSALAYHQLAAVPYYDQLTPRSSSCLAALAAAAARYHYHTIITSLLAIAHPRSNPTHNTY